MLSISTFFFLFLLIDHLANRSPNHRECVHRYDLPLVLLNTSVVYCNFARLAARHAWLLQEQMKALGCSHRSTLYDVRASMQTRWKDMSVLFMYVLMNSPLRNLVLKVLSSSPTLHGNFTSHVIFYIVSDLLKLKYASLLFARPCSMLLFFYFFSLANCILASTCLPLLLFSTLSPPLP
jgi:hypothetical protein